MGKLREIWIKRKTISISKWDDEMFMLNIPKVEVTVHADYMKFVTDDAKYVTLLLYHSNCYVGSIWITHAKDVRAIKELITQ